MLFGYLFKCLHVSRAGKALAGWKPTQEVVTASLDVLAKEDQERLEKLTGELFHFGPRELQKDG